MGLGKTVEIIALILSNSAGVPRVSRSSAPTPTVDLTDDVGMAACGPGSHAKLALLSPRDVCRGLRALLRLTRNPHWP
jgi:hypothetical protein